MILTGADIAILCVVLISALIGVFRGFIKEVFSLANWIVALSLAYLYRDQVGAALPLGEGVSPEISALAGGILIVIAVLILGGVASSLLHKLAKITGLTGTDRTLGVAFGLLRGCILVLALLIILPQFAPVAEQDWWLTSTLIPVFLSFEEWARNLMSDIVIWANEIFG